MTSSGNFYVYNFKQSRLGVQLNKQSAGICSLFKGLGVNLRDYYLFIYSVFDDGTSDVRLMSTKLINQRKSTRGVCNN